MATINVDIETVKQLYAVCKQSLNIIQDAASKISCAYEEASYSRHSDQYRKVNELALAFGNQADEAASRLDESMLRLYSSIMSENPSEPRDTGSGRAVGAAANQNSTPASVASSRGASNAHPSETAPGKPRFQGLSITKTGFQTKTLMNASVKEYNTPYESSVQYAIELQGSAFPKEFRGTCGCCSSGTVMNMAGFHFAEKDVVSYAAKRGLCIKGDRDNRKNGGTSTEDRYHIIREMSGIECPSSVGVYTLEELAEKVESGYGVILSIDASGLPGYSCPPGQGGHAVVLASAMRNVFTGKIIGYYIYDSNGSKNGRSTGRYDVCQFIHKEVLESCYEAHNFRANITEPIIR